MGEFLFFIFGLWIVIALACWPFMWAKKSERHKHTPFERRTIGLAHALAWPYYLVMLIQGKRNSTTS